MFNCVLSALNIFIPAYWNSGQKIIILKSLSEPMEVKSLSFNGTCPIQLTSTALENANYCFSFKDVFCNMVRDVINSRKPTKSCDDCNVPANFILSVEGIILVSLIRIINVCIQSNCFLDQLKLLKVIKAYLSLVLLLQKFMRMSIKCQLPT